MDTALPASLDPGRSTPMMEQYLEIKAVNPGALLFYRMGDFYELFFEDAEIAARALGIVLTKRGKHQAADIPMCGVPVVRAEEYLHRLIGLGHRVAVCEQIEDPAEAKKRGGKSVVRRDVVRLVTAGTITEETLLDPVRSSLFVALARQRLSDTDTAFGLAALDLSTGAFRVGMAKRDTLASELARLSPAEIVFADALSEDDALIRTLRESGATLAPVSRDLFDRGEAPGRVARWYGVSTIDGLGDFEGVEVAAIAGAIGYVERTQKAARPALDRPSRLAADRPMTIDAATRVNLELTRTLVGQREGSLLATIDHTVTASGARLLAQHLAGPLTDLAAIAARQDAVAFLLAVAPLRSWLRDCLKRLPDLVRALSRLALQRGGPRDLAAIAAGMATAADIARRLAQETATPAAIAEVANTASRLDTALHDRLAAALADELPLMRRDGGFVRDGFAPALDELRALRDESRRVIASLQARYVEVSGVRQLKVKHNNLIGYFVEVPQEQGETFLKPPLREIFAHRQTMAGAMRFSTAELAELETRIATAAERALAMEQALFDELAAAVVEQAEPLKAAAEALARLDVFASHATLAEARDWTRPVVDGSTDFTIDRGRHPVVEAALARDGKPFVANDCDLSGGKSGRLWLLTGPNMAGKSTFLRQNALIAVLAQIGGFVPAKSARIGVVDRLFSRVGAADDLARGRSTFMVEMVETAAILNQASPRSLVILDEIGRGTATFDGLSIAWATLEHLHDVNRCRAVFATHYHELTQATKTLAGLHNATMRVTEWHGDVVFLHEVAPGAADRSYGIQVARLAGLPEGLIARARDILGALESADRSGRSRAILDDLPLFAAPARAPAPPAARRDGLQEALDALDPDALSPREALEALYRLKAEREAGRKRS